MRRFGLILSTVFMMIFGPVLLDASAIVHAQDATPAAEATAIPPVLTHWAKVWSSGKADELAALYTEDAVYTEVPTGIVSHGRDEIAAFINDTLAAYPGVQVIPRSGFRGGQKAVLEADFVGTSKTGKKFSVPFVAIFEFDGKLISRETDYFDLYGFMQQLGLLPASEATPMAGTPTP